MNAIDHNVPSPPAPEELPPPQDQDPYSWRAVWPFLAISGLCAVIGYIYDDWVMYLGALAFVGISIFTLHLGKRIQEEMDKEVHAPVFVKPPEGHGVVISRGRRWILGRPGLFLASSDRLLWSMGTGEELPPPGTSMPLGLLKPVREIGIMTDFLQFQHKPRLLGGDSLALFFQGRQRPVRMLMSDPEGLPLIISALRQMAEEMGWLHPDAPPDKQD